MISKTKLEGKHILLRFYKYRDINMGYGDGGTIKFVYVPLEYFDCSKVEVSNKRNYYNYVLRSAGFRFVELDQITCGCEFATEEDIKKEKEYIKKHINYYQKLLENLESI